MVNGQASSAIQNFIKIAIFKLMVLRELWCMSLTIDPLTNFGLLFPVVCFVFASGQAL